MSAITPPYAGMSNEGQKIVLPDGRTFVFVWSGLIGLVNRRLVARCGDPDKQRRDLKRNSIVRELNCWHCARPFSLGEPYYNRRGAHANRKSRYYDLACAQLVGLIEQVKELEVLA
jgi:hypothetical protein